MTAASPEISKDHVGPGIEGEKLAIFDAAYECFAKFELLARTQDEDLISLPIFVKDDDDDDVQNTSSGLPTRDFLGLRNSFSLWVDFTGALSLKEASLDTRLRGLSDISSLVVELLDMILRNLQRLDHGTYSQFDNTTEQLMENLRIEDRVEGPSRVKGSESTCSPEVWQNVPAGSRSPERVSEWEEALQAVDSALSRLHFLATAIRRASAKQLEYNVQSILTDEDVLFRKDVGRLVRWKFPAARKALCEQLADSIAVRRRILIRKHRHSKKLAIRRTTKLDDSTHQLQSAETSQRKDQKKDSVQTGCGLDVPSTAGTLASLPNLQDASLRKVLAPGKPALSSIVSSASFSADESFEYPHPPKAKVGEKHVSCPYCLKPLDVSKLVPPKKQGEKNPELNEYWMRHIDEDLQPYICLFPECSQALLFFPRMGDWKAHMEGKHSVTWPQRVHKLTWYCDMSHEPPEQFETAQEWRAHMHDLSSHPGRNLKPPTEAQLDAISPKMQQLVYREKYVCPMCERIPEKIEPVAGRGIESELHHELSKHIASHLKSLSLLSLPCLYAGAEEDDADKQSIKFENFTKRRLGPGSSPALPSGIDMVSSHQLSFTSSDTPESEKRQEITLDDEIIETDDQTVFVLSGQVSWQWITEYENWKNDMQGMNEESDIVDPILQELRLSQESKSKTETEGLVATKYRVGKILGVGSGSTLRESVHIETGRYYAAKVVERNLLLRWSTSKHSIYYELAVLKKVSTGHPNIMMLVDYFETKNNMYLILDLAIGGELFDRICRKGSYHESDAARIIGQVVSAVAHLHDLGIVHRNIIAEKIFFRTPEDNSDVMLGGFGYAVDLEKEHPWPIVAVMHSQPAPELLQKTERGEPVDIWAVGVVTYFMLCGYRPFDRDTEDEERMAVITGDFNFTPQAYWSGVSDSAKEFVSKCLEIDPSKRITAHNALQHRFLKASPLAPNTEIEE